MGRGRRKPDGLDNPNPRTQTEGRETHQDPADPLAGLAAAIANLSPEDRRRLAAMLSEKPSK